jgi:hypothetical protein
MWKRCICWFVWVFNNYVTMQGAKNVNKMSHDVCTARRSFPARASLVMWLLLLSRAQSYFFWIFYHLSSAVITTRKIYMFLNKYLYCYNYCFDILSRSLFLICKYFRFLFCRAVWLKIMRIRINFVRGYSELVRIYKVSMSTDRQKLILYSPYGFHSKPRILWK